MCCRAKESSRKRTGACGSCAEKEQLTALLESDFSYDTVYLESDFQNEAGVVGEAETDACRNGGKKVYIALPFIVRDKDKDFLKKLLPLMNRVDGVLVRNLETLGFLQKTITKETFDWMQVCTALIRKRFLSMSRLRKATACRMN